MDYLIEFDYVGEEGDELNLKKGDIVKNVGPYEDGWVSGTLNGKTGVFPSNFGKQILTENIKIQETEEPKNPVKKVIGVGFGNIFQGKPILLKRISAGETKIQPIEYDTPSDRISVDNNNSKVEQVKVSISYEPANSEELKLEEGDIITVIDKKGNNDGLWRGKLNGKVGLFPFNFTVSHIVEEASKPTAPPVVNKGVPPPVLAAKPKQKQAPPRPQNNEAFALPIKTPQKTDDLEPEINFESSTVHKLLVSPTAERARRTNVRLPKKIGSLADNIDEKDNFKEKPKPIDKGSEITPVPVTKTAIVNVQKIENTHPEKEILKDNSESGVVKRNAVLRNSTMGTEMLTPKMNLRPKSQFMNNPTLANAGDNEEMRKRISALETTISDIEADNLLLRKEMVDLSSKHLDSITNVTNLVNKLLTEFNDEKTKRKSTEDELSQLKVAVAKLENLLS